MHDLCVEIVGAPLDDALAANVAKSGGNPFLAVEMIRSLVAADRLTIIDDRASVAGYEVLPDFVAAVDLRLRGLSPLAGRMLQIISVVNRRDEAKAETVGDRVSQISFGDPKFRLITLVNFQQNILQISTR